MRDCIGVVALNEQEHAEIGLSIDVLRIERDDFAKQGDGKLRLLFLQMLLNLLFQGSDSGSGFLGTLSQQCQPGHPDNQGAAGSSSEAFHVITYTTINSGTAEARTSKGIPAS